LSDLVSRGVLDFWCFVEHLAEEDETKPHKHVFCVPTSLFDTSSIIEYLKEFDSSNPLKPLTCINAVSSKFGDWFLYSCHDKAYLISKGQSRKYFYNLDDFISSDIDYFNELRHQIDLSKINRSKIILDAVRDGIPFNQLVCNGQIPIQMINQYNFAYQIVTENINTYRNNRPGHEIDTETGEIITDSREVKESEKKL